MLKPLQCILMIVLSVSINACAPKYSHNQGKICIENTIFGWTYDHKTIKTDHFAILSDSASQFEREKLSRQLETTLQSLTEKFEIIPNETGWYPSNSKPFVVYLNKTHPEVDKGFTFEGGMVLASQESEFLTYTSPGQYDKLITQELIHIICMAILAKTTVHPPFWFSEGFARYYSGPWKDNIRTIESLEILLDELNIDPHVWTPLSINKISDLRDEIRRKKLEDRYCPLYELAVRNLLEESHKSAPPDLLSIYYQMAGGKSFELAFASAFNMTLDEYQSNFYRIADIKLSKQNKR